MKGNQNDNLFKIINSFIEITIEFVFIIIVGRSMKFNRIRFGSGSGSGSGSKHGKILFHFAQMISSISLASDRLSFRPRIVLRTTTMLTMLCAESLALLQPNY